MITQNPIPTIIHDLKALKNSESVNQEGTKELASRINQLFTESKVDIGLSDQDCNHLYSLAKLIMISDPISKEVWSHLSDTVHQFACKLFPYLSPPSVKTDRYLGCPSSKLLKKEASEVIRFTDGHQFEINHTEKESFVFKLKTSNHKILTTPGPTDPTIDARIQEYIATLPFGIEQFFDIDSLVKKNQTYSNFLHLAKSNIPLLNHQLYLLKQTYLNKQLQALKIPIICPIDIGQKGDWTLEDPIEIKSLSTYFNETSNLESFKKQLAYFLLLEKTLGIYILGDSSTDLNGPGRCLLEMHGETLQCTVPKKRIEWIQKPFESRLNDVLKHLQRLFPDKEECFQSVHKLIEELPTPSSKLSVIKNNPGNEETKQNELEAFLYERLKESENLKSSNLVHSTLSNES